MKEAFEELYVLVKNDPGTLSDHLGKLTEEVGEFATAVNMINGRKIRKKNETDEEVKQNLVEEFADVVQVMGSILAKVGVSYDEAVAAFLTKNKAYASYLERLNK